MITFILGIWIGALLTFGLMAVFEVSSKSDDKLNRCRMNCKQCLSSDVHATVQQDEVPNPPRRISHGEMVQMELEAKALQKENEAK